MTSVENRILAVLDESPPSAEKRQIPSGGYEFVHNASKYSEQLKLIENIVDQNPNLGMPEIEPLLRFMSILPEDENSDALKELKQLFASSVERCGRLVIPKVKSVFS